MTGDETGFVWRGTADSNLVALASVTVPPLIDSTSAAGGEGTGHVDGKGLRTAMGDIAHAAREVGIVPFLEVLHACEKPMKHPAYST